MLVPGLLNYIISYLRAADLTCFISHNIRDLECQKFGVENGCWEMYRDLKINFVSDDLITF